MKKKSALEIIFQHSFDGEKEKFFSFLNCTNKEFKSPGRFIVCSNLRAKSAFSKDFNVFSQNLIISLN